jgi:hypothetical protein
MNTYNGWVLLHIIGVSGFLLAHGTSAVITLKIRKESDTSKIAAWLDLSVATPVMMIVSLLLLLIGGVVAAFVGHLWGQWWIWASLVLLILLFGLMTPLAANYFNQVRGALGIQTWSERRKGIDPPDPDPERFKQLQASGRPIWIAAVGYGTLLVILYLMVYKPGS